MNHTNSKSTRPEQSGQRDNYKDRDNGPRNEFFDPYVWTTRQTRVFGLGNCSAVATDSSGFPRSPFPYFPNFLRAIERRKRYSRFLDFCTTKIYHSFGYTSIPSAKFPYSCFQFTKLSAYLICSITLDSLVSLYPQISQVFLNFHIPSELSVPLAFSILFDFVNCTSWFPHFHWILRFIRFSVSQIFPNYTICLLSFNGVVSRIFPIPKYSQVIHFPFVSIFSEFSDVFGILEFQNYIILA